MGEQIANEWTGAVWRWIRWIKKRGGWRTEMTQKWTDVGKRRRTIFYFLNSGMCSSFYDTAGRTLFISIVVLLSFGRRQRDDDGGRLFLFRFLSIPLKRPTAAVPAGDQS